MSRKLAQEKMNGIMLSLLQLLLTIILFILLLVFRHFSLIVYAPLLIICMGCFMFTFLSQQSKVHRITGRYVALGSDLLLVIAIISCFVF